ELRAGNWRLAEAHLNEAGGILERTRQEALTRWMLATRATLEALRGQADKARATGEEALALSVAAGTAWGVGECHATLGFLDLSLDSPHAALEHLDRAAEVAARIGPNEPR